MTKMQNKKQTILFALIAMFSCMPTLVANSSNAATETVGVQKAGLGVTMRQSLAFAYNNVPRWQRYAAAAAILWCATGITAGFCGYPETTACMLFTDCRPLAGRIGNAIIRGAAESFATRALLE